MTDKPTDSQDPEEFSQEKRTAMADELERLPGIIDMVLRQRRRNKISAPPILQALNAHITETIETLRDENKNDQETLVAVQTFGNWLEGKLNSRNHIENQIAQTIMDLIKKTPSLTPIISSIDDAIKQRNVQEKPSGCLLSALFISSGKHER